MRVIKEKPIKVLEKTILETHCDLCGKISKGKDLLPSGIEPYIERIRINFGYGSKYDGDEWAIDLCEDCIEDYFGAIAQKKRRY